MAHFAVSMVHGPGWDPTRGIREQDAWDAHAAFMDGLVADGFVVLGGPVGDRQRVLLAIEAAGEPAIRARLAADPWAAMEAAPDRRGRAVGALAGRAAAGRGLLERGPLNAAC